jgi:hypothetical protein
MKNSKDFLPRISIKNLVLVEAKSDSVRRGLELLDFTLLSCL